jgi:hypothetical protein
MPLFVPVYQPLRSDQLCHSLFHIYPSRSPFLSSLGRPAPPISTSSPSRNPHILPAAIYLCALSIASEAYTQTSTPTARTDAFMHPYLLPPGSSFPCADTRSAPIAGNAAPPRSPRPLHRSEATRQPSFMLNRPPALFSLPPPRRAAPARIPWSS